MTTPVQLLHTWSSALARSRDLAAGVLDTCAVLRDVTAALLVVTASSVQGRVLAVRQGLVLALLNLLRRACGEPLSLGEAATAASTSSGLVDSLVLGNATAMLAVLADCSSSRAGTSS